MLKTSFSTLACPDWSWHDVLRHGPKFGYQGVEIRMLRGETDLLALPELSAGALPDRRRELGDSGFAVCGLSSSVRFDSPAEDVRREQVRIGRAYLELAVELGAGFVRVFGDVLPPVDQPDARNSAFAAIADGLVALGEAAVPLGVQVLIETHGDFAQSTLMQELMQRVNHPQVGVLWDTHHPWRFFSEPIRETADRLQPWVRHTHWKDSVAEAHVADTAEARAADERARRLMSGHRPAHYVLFGTGEFPARECSTVLREAGYAGWYSLEWEKAWHPNLAPAEESLPQFPPALSRLSSGD